MRAIAVLGYLVAEITLISVVAGYLGALATLGLLVLSAAAGAWVLRRAGARTLRTLNDTVRLGRAADREITDGLLRTLGGVLLVLPGFLSSLLGVACLVPVTRAPLRTAVTRRGRRYVEAHPGSGFPPPARRYSGDVVDGGVVEHSGVVDGEVVDDGAGHAPGISHRQTARGEHGTAP